MRLPPFPSASVGEFPAETPPSPGAGADSLLGAWSATRWQYRASAGARRHDVVCDAGATITLSISEGTWILSVVVPGFGARSIGGTWRREAGLLCFTPLMSDSTTLHFRVSGELLSLTTDECTWDFAPGSGEEPAWLTAVFVRL